MKVLKQILILCVLIRASIVVAAILPTNTWVLPVGPREYNDCAPLTVSRNGRWVAGCMAISSRFNYKGFLRDNRSGHINNILWHEHIVYVNAVNSSGRMSGFIVDEYGIPNAFITDYHGNWVDFLSVSAETRIYGMNESGLFYVGDFSRNWPVYWTWDFGMRTWVHFYIDGRPHFDIAGVAYDINNLNYIVGGLNVAGTSIVHAFLRNPTGTVDDLHTVGLSPLTHAVVATLPWQSKALAINDRSVVVGYLFQWAPSPAYEGNFQGFIWTRSGGMRNLAAYCGSCESSQALAINTAIGAHDMAVGTYTPHGTTPHAFKFDVSTGVFTDLNTLLPSNSDWVLEKATAIDDHGNIVGYGVYQGVRQGFILTP